MGLVYFLGLFLLVKSIYLERPWRGGANNHADPSLDLSSSTPLTQKGAASFCETNKNDH